MDETQTLNLSQWPEAANVTGTPDLVITTNQTNTLPTEQAERLQATIDIGFKGAPVEVEHDGEIGLICEGYASKYNEVDRSGEYQTDQAFSIISEEWGAQKEPLVLFNHALDTTIRGRPIGRGIGLKLEPDGVYVRVFVPRNAADAWEDPRARKRFKDIYNGIKSGAINAFSVGGAFWRMGKKLLNWATTELSITPTPCLSSATFTLGTKALTEKYGALPMSEPDLAKQSSLGVLTRPHWNTAMGLARQDGAHGLHDHLLGYPAALQGKHDSEDCSMCADQRSAMGVKAQEPPADSTASPAGGDQESDVASPASSPPALSATDVVKQATDLLAEYSSGVKAGRRHSKETVAAVKYVVQHLTDTFGLGGDEEGTNGEET